MGACQPGKITSHVDEVPLTEHVGEMAGYARLREVWGGTAREKKSLGACTALLNEEFGGSVHGESLGAAFGYHNGAELDLPAFALLMYRMRRIPQVAQLHNQFWAPLAVARPTKPAPAAGRPNATAVDPSVAFAKLLREVQGEQHPQAVLDRLARLREKHGAESSGAGSATSHVDARYGHGVPTTESTLAAFLWSDENDIMVPEKMGQYQDMDHPARRRMFEPCSSVFCAKALSTCARVSPS